MGERDDDVFAETTPGDDDAMRFSETDAEADSETTPATASRSVSDTTPDTPADADPEAAWRRWAPLLLLLILVGGTVLRMRDFNQPWKNANPSLALKGFGGALYSTMARNHVRYGFKHTRFAMTNCAGLRDVKELGHYRYLNHPPLYATLLALHFQAFGDSERAARLFPLVFSILSLLMLFLVVRLVANTAAALSATALMATLPMAVYYGTFVEVQSFQVMFVSLVMFWFYWKWHLTRRGGFVVGFFLAFLIGAALDWPIYLLAFGIFAHHLIAPGPAGRSKKIWLGLPVAVAIAFGLTAAFVVRLSSDHNLGPLKHAFAVESASGIDALRHATGWQYWTEKLAGYVTSMYTWPVLILAAVWIARALLAALFRRAPAGSGLIFAYLCMGAGYVICFPTGSSLHEYWSMYLIPVLCVGVALLLAEASRWTLTVGTLALAVWLGMAAWARYEPLVDYESSYYVQAGRAIQAVTDPEDSLTVLAVGTEEFLYTWYGDRTVRLVDPNRSPNDPRRLEPIRGRWLVMPRDMDRHPLHAHPVSRAGLEKARDELLAGPYKDLERREVGPLIFVRLKGAETKARDG